MKITLYSLLETGEGNKIDPEPKAIVTWDNDQISIETEDKSLEAQLMEFYSKPLSVRRAVSPKEGVVGFKEVEIPPNTEEFFRESVYLVRTLNYYGTLEGDRKVQLVALDFDGTLWDSVHECFILTREAYEKLGWAFPSIDGLEETFTRARFFARTGDDFYLLIKWIEEHPDRDPLTMTPEEEETLRKTNGNRMVFEKAFYAAREEWREKRFQEWCDLQKPYPGMVEQLRKIQKRFSRAVISTTKDAESVKKLLAIYNITLDVLGREITVDKAKQMNVIASTYRTPLNQIIFVDDLLDHVRLVKSLGVKGALAGWGYGNPRQKEEAAKLGIPVLALEDFAEQLVRLF